MTAPRSIQAPCRSSDSDQARANSPDEKARLCVRRRCTLESGAKENILFQDTVETLRGVMCALRSYSAAVARNQPTCMQRWGRHVRAHAVRGRAHSRTFEEPFQLVPSSRGVVAPRLGGSQRRGCIGRFSPPTRSSHPRKFQPRAQTRRTLMNKDTMECPPLPPKEIAYYVTGSRLTWCR